MLSAKELKQTVEFIFSLEQIGGGFSFASKMPATLEDTYYAVKSLMLIEKEKNFQMSVSGKTIDFISNIVIGRTASPKLRYQAAWLCRQYDFQPETEGKNKNNTDVRKNLEQFYYQILLLGKNNLASSVKKNNFDSIHYISDIAFAVLIMRMLDIKFNKREYVDKIRAIQNLDGGFGFNKGSTSFLENTYLAVVALDCLGEKPLDTEECYNFVQGCRTKYGGYGRQLSTVPFLEATYMALKCLQILSIGFYYKKKPGKLSCQAL